MSAVVSGPREGECVLASTQANLFDDILVFVGNRPPDSLSFGLPLVWFPGGLRFFSGFMLA